VHAAKLLDILNSRGIGCVSSVPCSFFSLPLRLLDQDRRFRHVPAANEGNALAIAAGAHLGGGRGAVIAQNSGFGNLINPLTSLVLPYRIPTLVLMSMRGWPAISSGEEQHEWMGRVSADWLDSLGIGYWWLTGDEAEQTTALTQALAETERGNPAFVLVPKGAFTAPDAKPAGAKPAGATATAARTAPAACGPAAPGAGQGGVTRAELVDAVHAVTGDAAAVFSTTGYMSRALFAGGDRPGNFYMQGSMGHAGALALGTALTGPERPVVVLDGDGALLMHLGAAATIGAQRPRNLVHVVFDNGSYASTGAQPLGTRADYSDIARACGYRSAGDVDTTAALRDALAAALGSPGPHMIVVRGVEGAAAVGGRASDAVSPAAMTERFTRHVVSTAPTPAPTPAPTATPAAGVEVLLIGWYPAALDALVRLGARVVNVIDSRHRDKARAHRAHGDGTFVVVPDSRNAEDVAAGLARHDRKPGDFSLVCAMREFSLVAAALLAAAGSATGMPLRTAVALRDKFVQKQRVREAGLPVTDCRVVDRLDELRGEEFVRPLVVKPLAGGGSRDTCVLTDADAVGRLADGTHSPARGPWLVEDYVPGTELHVDGVVRDGEVRWFGIARYLQNVIDIKSGGCVGSVILDPDDHPALHAAVGKLLSGVLDALGHRDGIFHVEVFEHDGELTFSECAGRIGGGMIREMVRHRFGVDLAEEWARAVLGLPSSPPATGDRPRACGFVQLAAPVGVLRRVPDVADVLARPGCVEASVLLQEGAVVPDMTVASNVKVGKALVEGDSEEEVRARLLDLADWFSAAVVTEAAPAAAGPAAGPAAGLAAGPAAGPTRP